MKITLSLDQARTLSALPRKQQTEVLDLLDQLAGLSDAEILKADIGDDKPELVITLLADMRRRIADAQRRRERKKAIMQQPAKSSHQEPNDVAVEPQPLPRPAFSGTTLTYVMALEHTILAELATFIRAQQQATRKHLKQIPQQYQAAAERYIKQFFSHAISLMTPSPSAPNYWQPQGSTAGVRLGR